MHHDAMHAAARALTGGEYSGRLVAAADDAVEAEAQVREVAQERKHPLVPAGGSRPHLGLGFRVCCVDCLGEDASMMQK